MRPLPIVYSCSGCSSAAQMANHVAIRLDRLGVAEMSCIAGVGGNVPQLVKVAASGRPIIAIDGCPLHCAKRCLEQRGLEPTRHFTLSELKVKRTLHADFDMEEAERVLEALIDTLDQADLGPEQEVERKAARAG